MKKIIYMKSIGCCLLMLAVLLTFSTCNDEDDVAEIFNGKTWKLARLTTENGKEQFYNGLWSSDKEKENSLEALKQQGNFTLSFDIVEVNGEITGTAKAHGIRANIEDASVKVDGKTRSLTLNGKVTGAETDKLAKAFMAGLLKVFKYEGDSKSLTLYFKDENTTKVMGFTAQ